MGDRRFTDLLRSQGVQTVPSALTPRCESGDLVTLDKCNLAQASLEFAIVWSFFFPLFENMAIAKYLEMASPDRVPELKDTFIALVVEGPFPHMMSGHRGRRHHVGYHSNGERS